MLFTGPSPFVGLTRSLTDNGSIGLLLDVCCCAWTHLECVVRGLGVAVMA